MKQWVQKLLESLDYDWKRSGDKGKGETPKLSEDRASLLYLIDVYNKNLIDIESHPVRRVREQLDTFAKSLLSEDKVQIEETLFKLRQYFSSYRIAEYTYIRKTFEEFKGIVIALVDQLAEDVRDEKADDTEIGQNLRQLKEAVEAESFDLLRAKSRQFISFYVDKQAKKELRRSKRMKGIKKNLDQVKQQLEQADKSARQDHLTGAYNRRSFDEHVKGQMGMSELSKSPLTMLLLDIDFFKKINDNYGHDLGDFVLKECVKLLQESFSAKTDFVARIGGEEFAVVLAEHQIEAAVSRAESLMKKIRKEVFIQGDQQLRFTVSIGIAKLNEGETADSWIKRADQALYQSKHNGRDRYTVSGATPEIRVA